jgi:hypothetical protein
MWLVAVWQQWRPRGAAGTPTGRRVSLDGWYPGRQHPVQLAAGADAELGEHLAQVLLDRPRAAEQRGADLWVGQAVPGSRATWASWTVSSTVISTVR